MLSQKDLSQIEVLVEEKLAENNKQFMTRSEMLEFFDEIIGELKTIRESITFASHRLSNHEDRITNLEEKQTVIPQSI